MQVLILVIIVIQYSLAAPVGDERAGMHSSEFEEEDIYDRISEMMDSPRKLPDAEKLLSLVNDILPTLNVNYHRRGCTQLDDGIKVVNTLKGIFPIDEALTIEEIISLYPSMEQNKGPEVVMALLKCLIQQENLEMMKKYHSTPYISGEEKPGFLENIHIIATFKKRYQMLHHLYETRTTPDEMILKNFQEMQKQFFSFDSLCQFIADNEFYSMYSCFFKELDEDLLSGSEDGSSSEAHESIPMILEKCQFFSRDDDVPDIFTQTNLINAKREAFQSELYSSSPIDLQELESWLKDDVIPYMKIIARHLPQFYDMDEKHMIYDSALTTVDGILYLLKDAALPHQKMDKYYNQLPDDFFNPMLPRPFFNSLVLFEFGVEFHTLMVKKSYFELQFESLDLEGLRDFISECKESVELIKKYQSAINRYLSEGKRLELIYEENELSFEEKFRELDLKEEITSNDIEALVMPDENSYNILLLGNGIGKRLSSKTSLVKELLGVSNDDIFYSSHPLLSGIQNIELSLPVCDRFSLSKPRSKGDIDSEY